MSDSEFELEETRLTGLGGWLIIVGFGLMITPIVIFSTLLSEHLPLFTDGTFALLTSESSEFYIPGFSIIMSYEILGNLILIFASFYLLFLFFKKSKFFPSYFIYFRLFNVLYIVLDIILAKMIFPAEPMFDPSIARDLFQVILAAAIWIPYMLRSQRVKNTFIF